MSINYTNHVNPRGNGVNTPQTQPIYGRESEMKLNNAGGYTFTVSQWDYLDRFLILGSEGGTYYVNEKKLTQNAAKNVQKCIDDDGLRVVRRVVEVSDEGLAPKNDPALFVLAMASAAKNESVRQAAIAALPKVARIGTHLMHYAEFVQAFRGWGRALRRGVGDWFNTKSTEDLVYQLMKYKSRDGWSNRDLLRLSHPQTDDATRNTLYKWVVKPESVDLKEFSSGPLARLAAAEQLARETDAQIAVKLITDFDLPREVVNTALLNEVSVWNALLQKMPLTAMLRNLGKMTSVGILRDNSGAAEKVVNTLTNKEALKKARVHPLAILVALNTYKTGHGVKGELSWRPVQSILEALDDAFYAAFETITPTGKRWLLGIDVSGSMTSGNIAGMPGITPNVAAAAMAMVTARVEKQKKIMGFAGPGNFRELGITAKDSLESAMKKTQDHSFGSTDCSGAILYALKNNIDVDAFVVYTDNETYAGRQQPVEALREYRKKTGIPAKLIVVAFTATDVTIADPNDAGMLDVVGFDSSAPQVMANFVGVNK